MSDFIIQIGDRHDPMAIAKGLSNRPGMHDRKISIWQSEWGSAVIQSPPGEGYEPFEKDDSLYVSIGHPRIIGFEHEALGRFGFCQELANVWTGQTIDDRLESLTGMFILAKLSRTGLSIVTDLLGSQPVYQTGHDDDDSFILGTHIDLVAEIARPQPEVDLVSFGELLVFDQISFPYTTYQGIRELSPASVHTWQFLRRSRKFESCIYWQPQEPEIWPSRDDISKDLEDALRLGAAEVSRGARNLAVTLSGGRDSRTVLALLKPHEVKTALTFCTRENRETEIASQVARAAEVKHVMVRRDPHFYGTLLERTMNLIGSEVRGAAHGFAIHDFDPEGAYDLIVGGYLSDTLLKDHFMPKVEIERLRKKSVRELLTQFFIRRKPTNTAVPESRWAATIELLAPAIRHQVEQRRRVRLDQISEIRPTTAAEWQGFWPISRQHDIGFGWGNIRLFCSDELFYFRRVIEVAARMSPRDRYAGTVAHSVFNKVCGHLNELANANTGVAASANDKLEGKYFKRLRRNGQLDSFSKLAPSSSPWNDVQNSWADPEMLLLHSPDWRRYRENVIRSEASGILRSILSEDSQRLIGDFSQKDNPRVSMALIQLGLHLRRYLSTQPDPKLQCPIETRNREV
jgi:hypothetical protein